MLVPPVAFAQSPPVGLIAPFTNTLVAHSWAYPTAGNCTAAVAPKLPAFNLTTGVGGGIERANGTGCGLTGLQQYAGTDEGYFLVAAPFTVPTVGMHTVREKWRASTTGTITVTNVSGSSYAWGQYVVEVWAEIFDVTSDRTIYGNTTTLDGNFGGYSNVSITSHVASQGTATLTAQMVPGHTYRILAGVVTFITVFFSTGYGATCVVVLNWGSLGNSVTLVAMTVS